MNPILVEVYRANVLESFHRGAVCVVNASGEVVFSLGDIHQLCYPRSAMKLLQVIPLVESGAAAHFGFSLEEIAVMCGSHNAESAHVKVVNSILSKIGLKQNDLKCGAQYPTSKPDADVLIQQKIKPSDIHNNCSGKHAGMLAMCVYKNYSLSDYLHPEHPLQQEILETCAAFYEYPKDKMHTALDGCSAPIFSVPVYHQALGYKNLALMAANDTSPREKAARKVIQAVSLNPFMIAGSRRYCTDMMQITAPKVIGKTGAEGVFCMSFTEKMLGVCIKIDDGKMQPQYHVAQALLEQSGLFSKEQMQPLHHYMQEELRNFNKLTTGEMVAVKNLFQDFPKL